MSAMHMNERLMVFAKAPTPGAVKTRLQPPLSPEQAASLHEAFVRDAVATHQRPGRRVTVWRAGDLSHPLWARLDVRLATQASAGLGVRMAQAFEAELEADAKVVIVGTDLPTLPPHLIDAAFAALDEVPLVIGPACDGGYYCLGMRGAVADIFEGPVWGTDTVLAHTLTGLNARGAAYRLLDFWYDVDRPADLMLLRAHLPSIETPLTHTRAALEAL